MQFETMQPGIYAKRDAVTAHLATRLRAQAVENGGSVLPEISAYLKNLPHDTSSKEQTFRKRTASEVIVSGYQTGCTDRSVVFLALAGELGLPAVYVETLRKDSLSMERAGLDGHVFTKIYDAQQRQWHIYDPVNGYKQTYELGGEAYLPVAMGRDHSAAYRIDAHDVISSVPEPIDSEAALRHIAQNLIPEPVGAKVWKASLGERGGRMR